MKVTVFVPLDSCTCCYDDYLERFTKIIMPYKERVEFEVKNGAGPEGDKYDIVTSTVVLENGRKFTKLSDFQGFLASTFGTR